MEQLLIWAVVLTLATVGVVGYARRFRRQRSADSQRLTRTRELGMDRAAGQYPLVDAGACIGCGSCVAACPEGAIGLDYQIDAALCKSHRACVKLCQVAGAIDFSRSAPHAAHAARGAASAHASSRDPAGAHDDATKARPARTRSAGGACVVALRVAREVTNATIVFIVCDRGDRYLSTGVFPA